MQVKRRVGQGAFGDVYTTEYETEENVKTVIVKKMLHILNKGEKWVFILDRWVFVLDWWVFI